MSGYQLIFGEPRGDGVCGLNGYFISDTGKVREHNEDAGGIYKNTHQQILAIIADGMGGHKAGDVASNMVISSLSNKWKESDALTSPDDAERWLTDTILETNNDVYRHAQDHEECAGMGTTIVAVICTTDFITIAHIGDSRCYLHNELGFKQVTEDHSLVNELVRSGQISKDDAEYHPRKNVLLKAMGTEMNVKPDVKTIGWDKNNKILLCSDGLSNKISDSELGDYIKLDTKLDGVAERLVELANDRGGEDNISIALISYTPSPKVGETEC